MAPTRVSDQRVLRDWNLTARIAFTMHYVCGIVGVAASTYAATSYPHSKLGAVASGICFGILGFAHPMTVYHKFMSAARILQHAVDLYQEDKIDVDEMIEARRKAEMCIEKMDESQFIKKKT